MDHIVAHAAQHNISFIIIRPTAYYKDFTDFPLRRMRVRRRHVPCWRAASALCMPQHPILAGMKPPECRGTQASSTMLLIGAGNNKFNPIDGTDLAGVMADLLQDPGASGNKQYQCATQAASACSAGP